MEEDSGAQEKLDDLLQQVILQLLPHPLQRLILLNHYLKEHGLVASPPLDQRHLSSKK